MTDTDRTPDERLDRRLAEDGERWRGTQPGPPDPDPALLVQPRRPRWQPLAAAAAVVVVAAGIVVVAARRPADVPPTVGPTGTPTAAPTEPPTEEVVRDGDTVAGQGLFFARRPGDPVRLCGPLGGPPRASFEPWPDPLNTPDSCRNALTVTGLDRDRLSSPEGRDGAVWGWARVEGVYRARTLTVTRQEPYVSERKDPTAADPVPCPEPPGGWPPGDVERTALRLKSVIGRHRDELNEVYVAYPYGWHLQDQSNRKGTMVYVVGTTGDVATARRLLEAVFPAEYLCVRKAEWSAAEMEAAVRELQTSPEAARLHVALGDRDVINDRITARMLVLTGEAARLLRSVAGGRVVPAPILRKVR